MMIGKISRLIYIMVLLFYSGTVSAQDDRYSTTSKAAIKSYEEGRRLFNSKQDAKAVESLKDAISKDASFVEAYMLLATVYEAMNKKDEAIDAYKKSFDVNASAFPYNYYVCAQLELKSCRYDDAEKHLNKYLSFKTVDGKRKLEVDQLLENCKFAKNALLHPVPFSPLNMGEGINSEFSEYYFSFSVDQKTMIFTRDIKDSRATFGHQEDFFLSNSKDGVWTKATQLGAPVNTADNEGAPSMSADGRYVIFTACNRSDGSGGCDLYLSACSENNVWSKPVNLGSPINTGVWESQPSFSSDGRTLYFSRAVKAFGTSNTDIFYSYFQDDYTWSEPVSVGSNINTTGNEESVFIHPDNQTLYFSSDGHTGMGGLDIYMSRKQEDGRWGPPVNLGYPINTCSDEKSLVVSADGLKGYFSSERAGGFGGLDIYEFSLYEAVRPVLTNYVKARVKDINTQLPLAAEFEIIDVESGKVVVKNKTDKIRGEFLACLPAGKIYMLNVSKENYLFYSGSFDVRESKDKQEAFVMDVALQPIGKGQSVTLKNVFFDTDKYDLKPESYSELSKLVSFLNSNPAMSIEIGGHTDNTGDKIKNQVLSENRAKAVMDYLISKKIAPSRLTSKGYGDTKPVADNKTTEGKAANRRTAFTVK